MPTTEQRQQSAEPVHTGWLAGFRLDPHYASSDAILDSLTPRLNALFQGEKARFSVGHQASFEVRVDTDEGFQRRQL